MTLCALPSWVQRRKSRRGVNSIFSNFSHHSLHRLNKKQDSKTHCPVAQGTVVCSGFFCIFALNFGYPTVLNNPRVFCCSMLKSIFDSVQILLHLEVLSSVTLIFHGLAKPKEVYNALFLTRNFSKWHLCPENNVVDHIPSFLLTGINACRISLLAQQGAAASHWVC